MKINIPTLLTGGLVGVTVCTGLTLTSISAHADNDSVTDDVSITVPVSCTMSGSTATGQEHTATLQPGIYSGASGSGYENGIGKTTLAAHCNDYNGFSIYAIGFTGETEGNNTLVGTSASGGATIPTKVYESTDTTSSWSMKVTKVTDSSATFNPANMSIANSFDSWHTVPDDYTKVAEYHASTGSSATDQSLGAKVETTYASYISTTQPADTYTGKVKYVMVHPYDHTAPVIADAAILDTGKTVNSKLKSVAATVVNGEETIITPTFDPMSEDPSTFDQYIKFISVHTSTPVPAGFTPAEMNTISSSASTKPIYVIFDNTNDAGIMHFYTEANQIALSPDSSFMFYLTGQLSDLSALSDWDTSNVTDMSYMFAGAGLSATTFTLDLSSWNTDNVTDMSHMFESAGSSATTWSVGDLSSWNTDNVTDMSDMFSRAGYSAATFTLDLSSWNIDNVTDMSYMFADAGPSATTWSVGDLSSWNTDNVTNMSGMFRDAGHSATTFELNLSSWNTANVTDMSYMFNSAGHSATTWSIGDLSSWNTDNVTDMSNMFNNAGHSATTWSVGDLSSWNTDNVTNMGYMFNHAGYFATTFELNLSSWNTDNVTNMSGMFWGAGSSAITFELNLSSWNTANVTSMYDMFQGAGSSATTWSVTIPQTNGGSISNTTTKLYGQTTSVYGSPDSGKSFTLAQ